MPDFSKQYLTVRSRENSNTITFFVASSATQGKTLQYSTDGGSNWTSFTMGSSNQTKTISLNSGETVMFKGDCDRMGTENTANKYSRIYSSKKIDVYGNIMSFLYGDDFSDKVSFKSTAHTYTFMKFFEGADIVDASNLILPATTLVENCYRTMFWNNSHMTTAPLLPAKTLVSYCYYHLFENCSSLSSIRCLATSGMRQNNSTAAWVNNVASSGTFEYPSDYVSGWLMGIDGVPNNWTMVVYVPPFTVDVDNISAPASGSAYTINLTSSNPWTATTEQSWLTVSPSSGTGDTALTVTISANGSLQRSGSITITDSNSNSITITVYQAKASVSLKSCSLARSGNVVNRMYREGQLILLNVAHKPYLDISEDEIDFQSGASSTTITVDSNMIWTASTSTPWITITTGASALNVAVSENTTGEDREGYITIDGRNMLGTVSTSITVNQAYVIDYTTRYLTTRSLANNNTITFIKATALRPTSATSMSYSTDNGQTWNTMTVGSGAQSLSVTLNSGETAIWKGICTSWISGGTGGTYSSYIHASGDFEVEGNMLSLCYGDNFQNYTGIGRRQIRTMFWSATTLVNAENLVIPITSVKADGADGTFALESMFYGCSNLVKGPKEIPMISGTVPSGVFAQWFYGCTKLTSAPPLNYTSLVQRHYYYMFYNCSSLKSITCLATSGINSSSSTDHWVSGISSSGTFYKKRGASWPTGNNGIPSGWTVVEVD